MKLILIRHGNALNHDIDALRPLSDQGKAEAKETGLFLQNFLNDNPKALGNLKVFHSELLRAKETALLITQQLSQSPLLQEGEDLLPSSPISAWMNNLFAFDGSDTVILVGHMPYMGQFASELLNKQTALPTGGCAIFEKEDDSHHFKLLLKNFN